MPQLDPTPWFITITLVWVLFLYFAPPKLLVYLFPPQPESKPMKIFKPTPWNWPWQ